ncbi:MAG TPA: T9SS type A sorting domain-containing protein [Flavobacteriaceae bacterium]|nr:T9SS type A sorting domain-containing protein [Flavobacteriaceae bacterium]
MRYILLLIALSSFFTAFSQTSDIKYTREWGRYFRIPEGTAVDNEGNFWVILSADQSYTYTFLTPDAHQSVYGGGESDVFIAKFSPSGELLYGSFFGGEGDESIVSISAKNGKVYIAGVTSSSQQIATTGSYQENLLQNIDPNGNPYNPQAGFLACFNTNGQLQWSTYFQGNRTAILWEVAGDDNAVYVWGMTRSDDLATVGAFRENIPPPFLNGQGLYEAAFYPILAKFNNMGQLMWCTYYGPDINQSTNYSILADGGMALDPLGNIYVGGRSNDTEGYYGTPGAHQTTYAGGNTDAFLSKFSSSGQRLWSTYYGGSGIESHLFVHIGRDFNFYLSGRTTSPNNIATVGAYQVNLVSENNSFVAKFNPQGQRLWGTYFDIGGLSFSNPCFADVNGYVFLSGHVQNDSGIATPDSWQENYGGDGDSFVAKFDPMGSNLLWGSYYGGSNIDYCWGEGLVPTLDNGFYISGISSSSTNIASPEGEGSWGMGGFIAKFVPCPTPVMPTAESPQDFQPGESLADLEVETQDWTGSEPILTWYADAAGTQVLPPETAVEPGTTYYVSQRIQGCDESELVAITVQNLGILENDFSNISLFPNPNNGIFTLKGLPESPLKMRVVDILGRNIQVFPERIFSSDFQISLIGMETGIYFLELRDENAKQVFRFVVE